MNDADFVQSQYETLELAYRLTVQPVILTLESSLETVQFYLVTVQSQKEIIETL